MTEPRAMTLSEAQAEAAKWGNLIRSLSRLQEVAETLGALEQNRSERQAEVDQLGNDISAATEHLEELHERIAQAEEQATAIVDEARVQARERLSEAEDAAQRLIADAHAQVKEAQTQAMAAQAEMQAAHRARAEAEDAAAQAQARLVAARAAARAVIDE